MKNPSLYQAKIRGLTKTMVVLFIAYITTAFLFTYLNESTQKEIQANFYGVEIQSDGKGASLSKQKPYICVEENANLIYTHECSALSWIGTFFSRLFFTVLITWIWFLMVPLRAAIFLSGGVAIFCIFYFFEKRKGIEVDSK